ncbi:expressed unknown protein [Seminavis robusta]|uniref:Uncharacterized protein n=1 Tax=Seminavis robusta TaxID=568900 RepID=A0A9N8E2J7_9STRA|nr:expressed unknown protein [Seminavis robusta]|eukprot:Sro491_g153700.1 n/a (186) ;mRNA; f:47063-47752
MSAEELQRLKDEVDKAVAVDPTVSTEELQRLKDELDMAAEHHSRLMLQIQQKSQFSPNDDADANETLASKGDNVDDKEDADKEEARAPPASSSGSPGDDDDGDHDSSKDGGDSGDKSKKCNNCGGSQVNNCICAEPETSPDHESNDSTLQGLSITNNSTNSLNYSKQSSESQRKMGSSQSHPLSP